MGFSVLELFITLSDAEITISLSWTDFTLTHTHVWFILFEINSDLPSPKKWPMGYRPRPHSHGFRGNCLVFHILPRSADLWHAICSGTLRKPIQIIHQNVRILPGMCALTFLRHWSIFHRVIHKNVFPIRNEWGQTWISFKSHFISPCHNFTILSPRDFI